MRHVTGKPIKLLGTGEKMDALEDFHPDRVANRILGMGDIVSLVERAAETIDAEKAQAMAKKMAKGKFDLDDLADQLAQVEKLGGMGGLMGMMPGMGKLKEQMAGRVDDKMIKRQRAIILSMTPKERRNPDLLKASRKKRIAAGSGMKVEDVNKLLKQHRMMADMMKSMGGLMGGGKGPLGGLGKMAGMAKMLGGGMPGMGGMPQPTPEQIEALQKQMGGKLPNLPGMPGGLPGLGKPGGLPGLGGGFPFGKKK
jgi:signal recognition particle subunit SRP54